MRRKDREKDADFAMNLIASCEYAILATANADGKPYCIPISPVVIGEAIYFHCAADGKKLENIKANSAVCISCVQNAKVLQKEFTTEYESAVAEGICEIMSEREEKISILTEICKKYFGDFMGEAESMIERSIDRVATCKITVKNATGKANK